MQPRMLAIAFLMALRCGLPEPALAIQSAPVVVTYADEAGNQRIYVFAEGDSGQLIVNYLGRLQLGTDLCVM